METAPRWPIDYETLKKGDIIPAARIEQITGRKRTDPKYSLAMVGLIQRIQRDLHSIGKTVTIAQVKGDLKVLTDAEASTYNHKGVRRHRRGILRNHLRNMAVDATQLTDDQKTDHDRYIEIDGRLVQAIRSRSSLPDLQPTQRIVPGLSG